MNIIKRIFHKHNWETFMDNITYTEATGKEPRLDLIKRANSMKKTARMNKANFKNFPDDPDWDLYEEIIKEEEINSETI